jgi:hypothetical protein
LKKAFDVVLEGGYLYTTEPYCVWLEDGGFICSRWPHSFKPTHFCLLSEERGNDMKVVKKSDVLVVLDDNKTEHQFTLNPSGQHSIHKITYSDGCSSEHIMTPTVKMLVRLLLDGKDE